jgi:hypothetical protein
VIIGKKEITDAFQKTAAVNMHDAVSKSIKTVQAEAKTRCPVNDGELRGSIYTAIETSSEKIVGICYTNKKYAQYVEFGTGPKGQKQHAGISCCLCLCTVALVDPRKHDRAEDGRKV